MSKGYPAGRFRPAYIAFVCYAATTLIFSPNTSVFRSLGNGAFMGYFFFPMFVAALLVSCISTVLARNGHMSGCLPLKAGIPLALIYIVSTISFAFFSYSPEYQPILVAVMGSLCGACQVPVCLQWAHRFTWLDYRSAILCSALLCIGSSVLCLFFSLLPEFARTVCYVVCVVVGALTPFILKPDPEDVEASSQEPDDASSKTLDLMSTLRMPALGLLLYAFMMSINKYLAFNLFDSEYAGGCIAALCIIPLFLIRSDKPLSAMVYRIIAPVIGGIVIVLSSFPAESGFHGVALFCVYVFLSALAILALAGIIAVMNAGEFSVAHVVSISVALGSAVSLAGLVWSKYFSGLDDFTPIIFVMISLYCAIMLVSLGRESWHLMNLSIDERRVSVPDTNAESSSDDASEQATHTGAWNNHIAQANLTAREQEILAYLGRGHSMTYIAETLFISESTVRTHVKHIYAKLDIHSREELFALIDQNNAS